MTNVIDIPGPGRKVRMRVESSTPDPEAAAKLAPAPVIDLQQERDERTPHLQGPAECIGCHHTWHAVAPEGTVYMDCPACGLHKGVFTNPVRRLGLEWECACGGSLFRIARDVGPYCVHCGREVKGW